MKLASYKVNGSESYGIISDDGVRDLRSRLGEEFPDLKSLIVRGFGGLDAILSDAADHALEELEFLPVIPNPGMIVCAGLNTYSHLEEFRLSRKSDAPPPAKPWLFLRLPRSLVGHGQPIEKPNISPLLDYEGEIALIIGKGGRHISKENALEHVAGYSICNEGSVRDFQLHSPLFTAGKNFMRSGSLGPWMVTADEISAPELLSVETRINGAVMQSMPYEDLIFKFDELISYVSIFAELTSGDVIITGTGAGVGSLSNPQVWLKAGDVCEIEVPGIGILRNEVVEATGKDRSAETNTDAVRAIKEARALAGVKSA